MWMWRFFFCVVVIIHFILLFFEVLAFLILPFLTKWYIALPCMTFLFTLAFSREECQLTKLENYLRKRIGKSEIKAFISYYIVKPIRKCLFEGKN